MAAKNLGVSGVLYTDRRRFYLDPQQFAELYPAATPFLSSLYSMGPRKADDPDYKMFVHRAGWRYQYLDVNEATPSAWSNPGAGAGTPGATVTVAVDNPNGVSVDSSLLNHVVEIWNAAGTTKKGVALITAVSGSNVTLKALGLATSSTQTVAALADNDRLEVIGTAFGEGTEAPEASSDELSVVWNSTQEFKKSVEITKVLQQAVLRGAQDELARLRMDKGNEHKMQISRSLWFGYRIGGIGGVAHGAGGGTDSTFIGHTTDADGNVVRTTMGLIRALERYGNSSGDFQNVFSVDSSTYTYDDFVDDMEKVFQYNPTGGTKRAYCGPGAVSFWSKLAAGTLFGSDMRLPIEQGTSTLGFKIRNVQTPHGDLEIVPEPIFRGKYSNTMVIVDMDNVELVQYEADEYNTNIKTDNDPRIIKDEYFSHLGLGIKLIEPHSLWTIS